MKSYMNQKEGVEDPEISNSCKKNEAMDEAGEKQVKKFFELDYDWAGRTVRSEDQEDLKNSYISCAKMTFASIAS